MKAPHRTSRRLRTCRKWLDLIEQAGDCTANVETIAELLRAASSVRLMESQTVSSAGSMIAREVIKLKALMTSLAREFRSR